MSCLAIVLWAASGFAAGATAADVQAVVNNVLSDGGATSVDCQRAVLELLAQTAESESGVVAAGRDVSVRDLDPESYSEELPDDVKVDQAFQVNGHGPAPMRVYVPLGGRDPETVEVYRRESKGMYVQPAERPRRFASYVLFEANRPGRYLTRTRPGAQGVSKVLLPWNPPSTDPAAKADWGLLRVRPEVISGAMPLILIHGLGTDRWGEFIEWAATSAEAEDFRAHFQLWDYIHPAEGVNAAVGFSRAYPGFESSIVAYLDYFIRDASKNGVKVNGESHYFPEGPYMILTHSLGGVKARAFLINFPEHAERVLAVVTLAAPHVGSPWATPEWVRHTVARVGFSLPSGVDLVTRGLLSEFVLKGYLSISRQVDLDAGWGNFDLQGRKGIPTLRFRAWKLGTGHTTLTLSPRDANQTDARSLPGYDDPTFEPLWVNEMYCGGLDLIMPATRNGMYLDKFFIYGGYLRAPGEWSSGLDLLTKAATLPEPQNSASDLMENTGLRICQVLMGQVASAGGDAPTGVYAVGDGFVPLQSELFLDGKEDGLLYRTWRFFGWEFPVLPYDIDMDMIREHTLVDPDRLRILPGWSHLDTVTGRYNTATGRSELFSMVLADLLSALP